MNEQAGSIFTDMFGLRDPELISKLKAQAETIKLKKNVRFYHEGEVPYHAAFLISGIVRGYLVDANGREITDCFCYRPGDPVVPGVPLGAPAGLNVETLAVTELLCIPMQTVGELMHQYEELWVVYGRLLVRAYNEHLSSKNMLYKHSARERYQWFLDNYPGIVGRVSNKHVASFLDMNPVTLSRLRRVMREERREQGHADQEAVSEDPHPRGGGYTVLSTEGGTAHVE